MGREIERKWLVEKLPEFVYDFPSCDIVQGYLCGDPVVRIRKSDEKYTLTYKGKGMMSREEYNLPLNEEAFNHLLPKCDGIIIRKTRYKMPIDGTDLLIEVDVFKGDYEGRIYAEVEFESEEAAECFNAPDWFGEDVTHKKGYSNAALAGF